MGDGLLRAPFFVFACTALLLGIFPWARVFRASLPYLFWGLPLACFFFYFCAYCALVWNIPVDARFSLSPPVSVFVDCRSRAPFSFLRVLRSCLEYSRGRAFFALPSRICFWGFSPAVRFFFKLLSLRVLLLAVSAYAAKLLGFCGVQDRCLPNGKKMYFWGKRRVFPFFVSRET